MNINSIFPVLNFKTKKYGSNNNSVSYPNLKPLKADTVSFGAKIQDGESHHIHLEREWFDNNDVFKLVKYIVNFKATAKKQKPENFEFSDFIKIIDYFGYKPVPNKSGHISRKNSYGYLYNIPHHGNDVDPQAIAALREALIHLDDNNGELMTQSALKGGGIPTPKEVQDFQNKTVEYDEKTAHCYRRHFEEYKAEQAKRKQEELEAQQNKEKKASGIEHTAQRQKEAEERAEREIKESKLKAKKEDLQIDKLVVIEVIQNKWKQFKEVPGIVDFYFDAYKEFCESKSISYAPGLTGELKNLQNQILDFISPILLESEKVQVRKIFDEMLTKEFYCKDYGEIEDKINEHNRKITSFIEQKLSIDETILSIEPSEDIERSIEYSIDELSSQLEQIEKKLSDLKIKTSDSLLKEIDDKITNLYVTYQPSTKEREKFSGERSGQIYERFASAELARQKQNVLSLITKVNENISKLYDLTCNYAAKSCDFDSSIPKRRGRKPKSLIEILEQKKDLDDKVLLYRDKTSVIKEYLDKLKQEVISGKITPEEAEKSLNGELDNLGIGSDISQVIKGLNASIKEIGNLQNSLELFIALYQVEKSEETSNAPRKKVKKGVSDGKPKGELPPLRLPERIIYETNVNPIDKKPADSVSDEEVLETVPDEEALENIADEEAAESVPNEEAIENVPDTLLPDETSLIEEDNEPETSDLARETFDKIVSYLCQVPVEVIYKDINNMVENMFTSDELKKLDEGSLENYEELVQRKVENLVAKREMKQIRRAQVFATIGNLCTNGTISLNDVVKMDIDELTKIVRDIESNPDEVEKLDAEEISERYSKLKQKLSPYQVEGIASKIADLFPDMSEDDNDKLAEFLENECNYYSPIINKNSNINHVRNLIKMLMKDFDANNGTNYAARIKDASQEDQKIQQNSKKIAIIDSFLKYINGSGKW